MIDLEKVLKGLECCTGNNSIETLGREHLCKMCPYHNANFHFCFNRIALMKDAFELLKEQQVSQDKKLMKSGKQNRTQAMDH